MKHLQLRIWNNGSPPSIAVVVPICYVITMRSRRPFPENRPMAFGMSMTQRLVLATILAGGLLLLLRWALV
ncbi:MAG: hypothetical protein IPK59_10555 [Rhodospirillaceae bacterium]|nr:hypothetical protein [Rhodospirillaceae bacterium]